MGWGSPKELQAKREPSEESKYFRTGKPKVCKITKGQHAYTIARLHTGFNGKYLWTEYQCKCGKKNLEFHKEPTTYASELENLKRRLESGELEAVISHSLGGWRSTT